MQYERVGSNAVETMTVSDSDVTISGLTPNTEYSISVAAVNADGVGVYSDSIFVITEGMTS